MVQIKQTSDGDIDLSSGKIEFISGNEMVLQHIRSRLNFFKGTFEIYEESGVPYLTYVFGKKDTALASTIIQQTIEQTPDVLSVNKVETSFNNTTRELFFYFEATTIYSEITSNIAIFI